MLLLAVISAGCAPQLVVRLKAYHDPDRSPQSVATFQLAPQGFCQQSELLEKILLRLVADRLQAKGIREVADHGEAMVTLRCEIAAVQQYVPPKTYYVPVTSQSTTESSTTGNIGTTPIKEESSSTTTQTHYVPVTEHGYYVTRQSHRIGVRFAIPPKPGEHGPGTSLWEGKVETRTTTTDTLLIAPLLLDELFSEFPVRSGRPLIRTVQWKPPK